MPLFGPLAVRKRGVKNGDFVAEDVVQIGGNRRREADFRNEEDGGPTFSAVNARSDHPGGVNVLLSDGSVRFVKSTIDGMVWRAVGTVAGAEVISAGA